MANRKEDEKNERIIRSLLKLPENRRCINCSSLGPQYVCINFWTFVCTTCGGIHREFTHRVKSVSMAKFTSQEVAALQGGGNMRAKESLFKDFDPQRHSFPDNSNVERLRDFIKHAYVDRRYGGGRGSAMPPKAKLGEDSYDSRKSDSSRSGSRSPPYEDAYERRYSDRPSSGGRSDDSNSRHDERSPAYDRESQQFGDYRSPDRPSVVNDWRKEDRFGNGKKLDDRKGSDDDSRSEGRSPDHQKDKDNMSPPIVRPVRDILGDNVVPLRIIEPPKANGTRISDAFANTRRTTSSSSLGSSDGNPAETKRETLASLIDFDADPEPSIKTTVQEPQQTFMVQPAAPPTSTSGDTNWASFDLAIETPVSQVPSNTNNFDSVLSQLSAPTSVLGQLSGALPPTGGHSIGGPVSHPSMSTYNGGIPAAPSNSNPSLIPASGQMSVVTNKEHSLFPTNGIQPSVQPFPSQTWNSSFATNTGFSRPQAPRDPPLEVKSSGRTALPEDLFAPTYPSYSVPSQGWNSGPPGGMQYNTAVHIPTFPQSSKLSNPFDLNADQNPLQAPSFPSMASLHGSLPNMPPSGLMQNSVPGLSFPAWAQNQVSPHPSALPTRGYMGQQVSSNMPPSWHQGGGFGNETSGFNSMNSNQHMARGYTAPANPAQFPSAGGNPFG